MAEGGSGPETDERIQAEEPRRHANREHRSDRSREPRKKPAIVSATALRAMTFDPVRFVAPGYLAEGLTLLAGRPKLGKSWLMLDMAIAVAAAGESLGVRCARGDVLYLALEDNLRRLRSRLDCLMPTRTIYRVVYFSRSNGRERAQAASSASRNGSASIRRLGSS